MRTLFLLLIFSSSSAANVESRYADFWQWFEINYKGLELIIGNGPAVAEFMKDKLHTVHAGLTYEVGKTENGMFELVISADGIKEVFPHVKTLIAEAPKIKGWKFTAFRPRKGTNFSIEYEGVSISTQDIWFKLLPTAVKPELHLFIKGYEGEENKSLVGAAFVLLDAALGEYDTATKIGVIEWNALPEDPKQQGLFPWDSLPETFDRLYAGNTPGIP